MPMTRRRFLKTSLISALGLSTLGTGGFLYARDIEPEFVEIVRLDLSLPRLAPAFAGFRIAQLSDIHMGTGMTPDYLRRIAALVNAEQPDAIAITGDFVTHGSMDILAPMLIPTLSTLSAREGVFAVLGNHDHWIGAEGVRRVLRESQITELRNTFHTITRDTAALHIAGVDDHWEGQERLDEVLAQLPAEGAALLLAHEPDFADISAATGRFDLQLSGHSHGGQVILPLIGPPVLPRLGRKYPIGRYQVGEMIQYTNRGVGTVRPSVRFNCRPEITLFTLHPTL